MADKKELDQIRPVKGAVKIKRKPNTEKVSYKKKQSKVIQDVGRVPNPEEMPLPNEDAVRIVAQLNRSKEDLMNAMRTFNHLLNDSILPENKSNKEKEYEQMVINQLAQSALEIEKFSPGEGVIGLCVLAIRQGLSLRDAGNSLAYRIHKLEEKKLDPEKTIQVEEAKQKVNELAKQLGVNIVIKE